MPVSRHLRFHRASFAALLAASLAVSGLAACQAPATLKLAAAPRPAQELLRGRVVSSSYHVQSTDDFFTGTMAVTLIGVDDGVIKAAGLTDNQGSFVLYRSTENPDMVLAPGSFYRLEVMKRNAGVDNAYLSLRTILQRTPTGWTSITGPQVLVSLATTAISEIQVAQDLPLASVLGLPTNIANLAAPLKAAVSLKVAELEARFEKSVDPIGPALVWKGDYTITSAEDVERLFPYQEVTGTLDVSQYANVDLPILRRVGALRVQNASGLNLPNLAQAGSVSIVQSSAITSLGFLANLREVDELTLQNLGITNLHGLENLTRVRGKVSITSNAELTSLAALSHLTQIDQNLEFDYNPKLVNFQGLENLTQLGGDLKITGHTGLLSCTGLSGLTQLPGSLVFQFNTRPGNVPLSTSGLNNLQSIQGNLVVEFNGNTTFDGFTSLKTIQGNLSLHANDGLTNLNGLGELTSIGGYLNCDFLMHLSSFAGLAKLKTVGGFVRFVNLYGISAQDAADWVSTLESHGPYSDCDGDDSACPRLPN